MLTIFSVAILAQAIPSASAASQLLAAVNAVSSHHEESRGARGLPSQVRVCGKKQRQTRLVRDVRLEIGRIARK